MSWPVTQSCVLENTHFNNDCEDDKKVLTCHSKSRFGENMHFQWLRLQSYPNYSELPKKISGEKVLGKNWGRNFSNSLYPKQAWKPVWSTICKKVENNMFINPKWTWKLELPTMYTKQKTKHQTINKYF